ncbi:aspartate/glutamate racemase family protein [Curvibacter sp. RS43]|uniref:aspartate/glutamate racemase family protein n=1 Tax=Curvibacter microcysteis TaxID=3026419 RepID=UPI0023629F59|nr:aspartate/glutamate racemase family protein [Curvibacter sp. RS43]MDD0808806.1 aspartate/glutamate racemase family protein [Curvibacter sp. RS43]
MSHLPQPARLGLIRLDTQFPRPPGDLGRADSFPAEVLTEVVSGAVPRRVVGSAEALLASGLLPWFEQAAQRLVAQGAQAITTSCGFLVLLQAQLQAAVPVPVVSSSLLGLPALLRRRPQVGVLTIQAEGLGPAHLLAAGVPAERLRDVWVQGLPPDSHFVQSIVGNRSILDVAQAERDVVAAALQLQARAPHLGELVLECTNLPPYAQAVADATGWTLLTLLQSRRLLGERAVASSFFIHPSHAEF